MPQGMEWAYGLDPMVQALLFSGALGPSVGGPSPWTPPGFSQGRVDAPNTEPYGPFAPWAGLGTTPGVPNPLAGMASSGLPPGPGAMFPPPPPPFGQVFSGSSTAPSFRDVRSGGSSINLPVAGETPAATKVAPTGKGGARLEMRGGRLPKVSPELAYDPIAAWNSANATASQGQFQRIQQPYLQEADRVYNEPMPQMDPERPSPMERPMSAGMGLGLSNLGSALQGQPDRGLVFGTLARGVSEHYDEKERNRDRVLKWNEKQNERMDAFRAAGLTAASDYMREMSRDIAGKYYDKAKTETDNAIQMRGQDAQIIAARIYASEGKANRDKADERIAMLESARNFITDIGTQIRAQMLDNPNLSPQEATANVIISRSGQPTPDTMRGLESILMRARSNLAPLDPADRQYLEGILDAAVVEPFRRKKPEAKGFDIGGALNKAEEFLLPNQHKRRLEREAKKQGR